MKGSRLLCLLLALCAAPAYSVVVYEWKFLEYAYDTPEQKQNDTSAGNLIPNKPAPIDLDVYYDKTNGERTVFVTSPRSRPGVPASLGTVVLDNNNKPTVKPYPSWEWFKDPEQCKPNRIVSVYRIMIDECDRLWVLDSGELDVKGDIVCPPQVLAFDLKTNKLIHKYEIPRDQYGDRSTFATPIVEVRSTENQCQNTFLYLADCVDYGIVVYDVANTKSWKIEHLTMYPDPDFGVYNIAGETFELMYGVLGMSLSPKNDGEERKLFYHAMSSDTEHWIYTRNLQNETRVGDKSIINSYVGRRGTQSAAEATDDQGVMYFGLMTEQNIACFNTQGQYGRNSSSTDIVATDTEKLQGISGMKVINAPNGQQELWAVSTRFQKVANNEITDKEVNFRIMSAFTQELIDGTKCDRQTN